MEIESSLNHFRVNQTGASDLSENITIEICTCEP